MVVITTGLMAAPGCREWRAPIETRRADTPVEVGPILERCTAVYQRATSLDARGELTDLRGGDAKPQPMAILMRRPDRCRVEIGGNAVVVLGRDVWTYTAGTDRFNQYHAFTATPALTAAELASGGITFPTIDLFIRGARAMDSVGPDTRPWRLEGMSYSGRRPCFVVAREQRGAGAGVVKLLIDQDTYVLRGWRLYRGGAGADDRPTIAAEFHAVQFDVTFGSSVFRISRPICGEARP